jgi:hypothetical protein
MPGIDAAFCKSLEIEWMIIRNTIDLVLPYPEQLCEKIKSYCYRIVNVVFKQAFDEIEFWKQYIDDLIDIIKNTKIMKNAKRICLDMMKCKKLYELVANKSFFGNISQSDLEKDPTKFLKYVCQGKWYEYIEDRINYAETIVNNLIIAIQNAIVTWTTVNFNIFMSQYNTKVRALGLDLALEKLDAFVDCLFGACNIGATIKNWETDVRDRLNLSSNGRVNRNKFTDIFKKKENQLNEQIDILDEKMKTAREAWKKKLP